MNHACTPINQSAQDPDPRRQHRLVSIPCHDAFRGARARAPRRAVPRQPPLTPASTSIQITLPPLPSCHAVQLQSLPLPYLAVLRPCRHTALYSLAAHACGFSSFVLSPPAGVGREVGPVSRACAPGLARIVRLLSVFPTPRPAAPCSVACPVRFLTFDPILSNTLAINTR